MPTSLFRKAHGNAAKHGALIVVETPPLDELTPLNPEDAEKALANTRGRPFQRGNRAAEGRGPSLTRVLVDPGAPSHQRRIQRKAASLKRKRQKELEIQHGASVSTAVLTELVAWSRNVAWAEYFNRIGDSRQASTLTEKASGHSKTAIAIAEREAASRLATANRTPRAVPPTPAYRVITTPALPAASADENISDEDLAALMARAGVKG